jgi:hypothetical protein
MSLYIERNNGGPSGGQEPHGDPQRGGFGHQAKSNQDQRTPYTGGVGQSTPGMGGMNQGGMNQGGANQSGMNQGGMGQGMQGGGMQGGMSQPGMGQQGMQNGMGANGGMDYRDELRMLLDKAHAEKGLTRYRLCKQMGIDSGTLSNVLAKRRHFSLEKLEQILHLLGYRLSFTQDTGSAS